MKLKYNKGKNALIRRQNDSMCVRGMWYQFSTGTWVERDDPEYDEDSLHTSHHGVSSEFYYKRYNFRPDNFPKTERALKKYLKRHPELHGKEITVMTRYSGHFLKVQW